MKTSLLAALLISIALPHVASANDLACSPYDAVYIPSPAMSRADGIHQTLTIEEDDCGIPPCAAAKVYLNTLDKSDRTLRRIGLHYECRGTGWTCLLNLVPDDQTQKTVSFDAFGITKQFERIGFLGDKGQVPYAYVFPGIDRQFRHFNWSKAATSVETKSGANLPLEIEVSNDTPTIWVFSKCDPH